MKRLLPILLLMIATVAGATDTMRDRYQRSVGHFNTSHDRTRAVAWITDGISDSANWSSMRTVRYCSNQSIGRLKTVLRRQGMRVDEYDSRYFRSGGVANGDTVGDSLWKHIGEKYAVVIYEGATVFFGDGATNKVRSRFFCPDSLDPASPTPHIIHLGMANMWREDSGASYRRQGTCVWQNAQNDQLYAHSSSGTADSSYHAFITPRGDSIYFNQFAYAVVSDTTYWATGVSRVVSLFRPTKNNGYTDAIASTVAPASGYGRVGPISRFYTDSLVSGRGIYARTVGQDSTWMIMPVAWRVYWESGGWVDYVLHDFQNSTTNHIGHVLLALINRYTDGDPIDISYEWDDLGTPGMDDRSESGSGSTYLMYSRWADPAKLTPWITQLDSMGVKWNTTGPGDSLYLMATTAQTTTTNASGFTYPFILSRGPLLPLVAHVHDSTRSNPFGCVLGKGTHAGCRTSCQFIQPRLAFNDDGGLDVTNWRKWGVYQRIRKNDSLYTAKFGRGRLAPYLSFPTDVSAPINMRLQTSNNGWGVTLKPDSMFLAFALAGKTTVRGFVMGQDTSSAKTRAAYSVDATGKDVDRYFVSPGERFRVRIPATWNATGYGPSGRVQDVRCVGTVTVGTLSVTHNSYKSKRFRVYAQTALPALLGTRFQGVRTVAGAGSYYNETVQTATGNINKNDDTARCGIFYQHPHIMDSYGPFDGLEMEKECFRIAVRDPLAALSGIAGKDFWRWVYPWQVGTK